MKERKKQLLTNVMKMIGLVDLQDDQSKKIYQFLVAKYNSVDPKLFDTILDEFGPSLYQEELFRFFDNIFTEDELQKIAEFYSGPIGSKMCNKNTMNKLERLRESWYIRLEAKLHDAQNI